MMVWRPQRGTAPTADEDKEDDPARVIVDVEMEKSLLYLGARYGNDVSKLFFAHHTSRKKKAVIDLECARAPRADYEHVSLGAQLMPLMQYARPSVCDVAPLPALTRTETGGGDRRCGTDTKRHQTGAASDGVRLWDG
jgi:hypothetical protein